MSRGRIPRATPETGQFAVHEVIDEPHQGMLVGTFEHPREWQAFSDVFWNYDDVSLPMNFRATTFNPNGTETLEFLPLAGFFWLEPNFMYAPGQEFRGQVCLPPMRAEDALLQQAIPKYRGGRQNLRIVQANTVPNLAQLLNADELNGVPNEGVMARLAYVENGQAFEEEFYACCYWQPPAGGQINWGLARLACFRAARGQLDAARQTFWRILTSWRKNPQWQQLYNQISQQIFNGFKQMHAGFRARIHSDSEWAAKMAQYRQGQRDQQQTRLNDMFAADERKRQQERETQTPYSRADAVGDILRGQTAYDDPASEYGNPHYAQGSPKKVWTDKNGHWIESESEEYNPNLDPEVNGDWVEVRERKLGQ
jgi:hypothetical protein